MATISASNGQVLDDGNSTPYTPSNPYNTYVSNMSNLLSYITKTSSAGNAAMIANNEGLQRGQAALATPNSSNNPLNGLYAFMPGSARTGVESTMGNIMNPAILSNAGQAASANQTASSLQTTTNDQLQGAIAQYNATKPVWTLSPQPNDKGQWYYYNTNTPAGLPPQTYAAGQIPPGAGGSPGGSPGSASSPATLSAMNNPYGIKMANGTESLFESMGGTPGVAATDGGYFWNFPDATTGEKAARALLTSSTYANDSVDQALRQWSNYTGTGQYPGYNGDILKGTGIDPNATIKSLSSNQIDVVLNAMKTAENVGGANNASSTPFSALSGPYDNSTYGQIAHQIAWGINGMTYDKGMSALNAMPGGSAQISKVLADIQKENPNFNLNTSAGTGEGQAANTTAATTLQPLVDATNGIINGQPAEGGNAAVPSITTLYDNLPPMAKTSSMIQYNAAKSIAGVAGDIAGQTAIQQWEGAVSELKAKAESVLLQAANLGISTGGTTADSLFPANISKEGLAQSIARVQGYEQQMLSSLRVGGGQSATVTNTQMTGTINGKTYVYKGTGDTSDINNWTLK